MLNLFACRLFTLLAILTFVTSPVGYFSHLTLHPYTLASYFDNSFCINYVSWDLRVIYIILLQVLCQKWYLHVLPVCNLSYSLSHDFHRGGEELMMYSISKFPHTLTISVQSLVIFNTLEKTETLNMWYLSPVLYGSCIALQPSLFVLSSFIIFPNQLTHNIFISVKIFSFVKLSYVRPFQISLLLSVSKLCRLSLSSFSSYICIYPNFPLMS